MLPLIVDTVHTYLLDQYQFILYQLILLKSKGIQMGYVKLISLMANKKCVCLLMFLLTYSMLYL